MTTAAQVTAIIPARDGSKGLPGKNVRLLAGKPLYMHSVDAALAAGIGRIIISTDIDEIFTHPLPPGVECVRRPPELAQDSTVMAEVLQDLLPRTGVTSGIAVLLQPTSPLRRAETVRNGIGLFRKGGASLVMSVSPADSAVLKWGFADGDRFVPLVSPDFCFANRQSLPTLIRPNGVLYVFDAAQFMADGNFSAESIRVLPVQADEAQDIDTAEDFLRCADLMAKG
ncbi:N-acylneuraminate cytidylyltransferase [Pannonibacter phragmitetus]|uniref:N-acylneuraminate cytidylyltransferase n=1 Tax=Pannonibacter phragmitetus TaxID=121719 RepID=A0A378ZT27_9HYPH|nr:acylneuraminate cytidylyltransferase family protein [Pannonibacter phragmitetus]SUB00374.1 N-acylneuraminate cytidylyltransferase [Pannonibacter phragmitetus]